MYARFRKLHRHERLSMRAKQSGRPSSSEPPYEHGTKFLLPVLPTLHFRRHDDLLKLPHGSEGKRPESAWAVSQNRSNDLAGNAIAQQDLAILAWTVTGASKPRCEQIVGKGFQPDCST